MALFNPSEISSVIEIYKFLHDLSLAVIMGNIIELSKPPTYKTQKSVLIQKQ